MSLVVMGTSHKTAAIETRERVSIPESDLITSLHAISTSEGIKEALVLSTCNRTEIYVDAKTDRLGAEALEVFFAERGGANLPADTFYVHRGIDAVQHVFRVVSSLDSQVLGEAQILGQTKRAFEAASEAHTCGEVLTKLFKSAIHLGKCVRTETAIGADSVSLSTTAFKVAHNRFPNLAERSILVMGAGEMARLAATYLADAGAKHVVVASRTFENAQTLASTLGAQAIPFEDRLHAAAQADVVFTMTGAPQAIIKATDLAAARAETGTEGKPLILIDEALPRDVDPACAHLPGVEVHDLEALSAIVDEGIAERMAAVGDVERLVSAEVEAFLSWLQERYVTPTIKEMRAKAEAATAIEIARAEKALVKQRGQSLDENERAILEALGRSIANKLLHGPTIRLRKEAQTADSYYYTGAARYLFGLETYPPGATRTCCEARACATGGSCPKKKEKIA